MNNLAIFESIRTKCMNHPKAEYIEITREEEEAIRVVLSGACGPFDKLADHVEVTLRRIPLRVIGPQDGAA
jgi:hypothetical protein